MHNSQHRLRKLVTQLLDQRQRRIVSIARPEQHFVFRVIEQTMAAQSAVHVGIEPLQRLQDTGRRSEGRFTRTKTGAVAVEVARRLGLTVFEPDRNLGYGGNQQTCYREALAAGADVVVMVHPEYEVL